MAYKFKYTFKICVHIRKTLSTKIEMCPQNDQNYIKSREKIIESLFCSSTNISTSTKKKNKVSTVRIIAVKLN